MAMNRFRTHALAVLLGAAVLTAPAALVFAPPAACAADEKKGEKGEDTELQKQMEVIEAGMKKLRKSLRSADDNAESLKTIADIKKAAVASKDQVPAMASTLPEAERAKFVAAYKKDMEAFIAEVDKMEASVKAGKNDEAAEVHKKLKELEDAGHEKYTKE